MPETWEQWQQLVAEAKAEAGPSVVTVQTGHPSPQDIGAAIVAASGGRDAQPQP